ncbi:50S ribosomal protein L25 [Hathewaya histolytica]|uniref:Large ribosomal subunit protein bL25 n=1 Tax=Hathewaya histolytica TaxID=1498 RepID=A0A4V6KBN4_HATHI|nr:50S ribosomal protein L25 [Hathewaya histolytica]VTQ83317.1 ribosomal 5S rRNA E-loop binding protein Ctc/L25/TL5 [Hathewaya histolytica]
MSKLFIKAAERNEKGKKVRKEGFTPGVMYLEESGSSVPIKFDKVKVESLLRKATGASIVQIKLNDDIKNCVVKDVQRDNLNNEVMHLDVQAFSKNEDVTVKVPINFKGIENLTNRRLLLETFVDEIEVTGKADGIPEAINLDVGSKDFGEKIMLKDIEIDKNLDILHEEDEVFAIVVSGERKSSGAEDNEE